MTKNILYTTLFIFATQILPANAQTGRKTYIRYESETRGYTELVTSYTAVRSRMISDIRKGHVAEWKVWVDNGVNKKHSLYLWLQSEIEWQQGRKEDAYITAISALMLTRTELNACAISSKSKEKMERDIMLAHQAVVDFVPRKAVIRHSILKGGAFLDSLSNSNFKTSGQSCYRAAYLAGKQPIDMTRWSVSMSASSFKRVAEDTKEKMGYYRLLKTTTIDEDLNRNTLKNNFKIIP